MLSLPVICLAAVLVGVVGFSAHRANLCSVRAVEEVLTTRRAFMLASFVKTILWVLGVSLVIAWTIPANFVAPSGWTVSKWTIGGGLLFGVGATLNGGCAISTLTRLGTGNIGMMVSLAGFLVGAGGYGVAAETGFVASLNETSTLWSVEGTWRPVVTVLLIFWMIWELTRLLRSVPSGDWRQRLRAPLYRLSTAAALIGLSNAVLYALVGVWPYTRLFSDAARHVAIGTPPPPVLLWLLFAAFIGGVVISAWQSSRVHWKLRPRSSWIGYGAGGILMGLGAAMIPGGNDILLMHGVPSLSPHAVPAFIAMFVGIAASLAGMRALGQTLPQIDCTGDICNTGPDDRH